MANLQSTLPHLTFALCLTASLLSAGSHIGGPGHYITGGTLIYLLNPDGKAFTVTLHRYNWPFKGSWNRDDLQVKVTGPGGKEAFAKTLTVNEEGTTFTVPAGAQGTYEVDVNEYYTLNYWYLKTSLPRAVAWTGPGTGVAYRDQPWFVASPMVPRIWHFWVPDGTKKFSLKAQSCVARSQREDHGLIIRSPRGQPMAALWDQANPTVRDGQIVASRKPPKLQEAHIVVEPGSDGRFWSLEARLGGGHTYSEINLCLQGVPPYLSHSPETWFDPRRAAPPDIPVYDDDPFVRSDVPPEEERARPYCRYWTPCPALGDPDGCEILTPARMALWNPEGRELALTVRTYIVRDSEALKRGAGEPETAHLQCTDAEGKLVFADEIPMLPEPAKHYLKKLSFRGMRFFDITDCEHFWAYTYPATPAVLVGTKTGRSWHRFRFEAGTLRHWHFFVPDKCKSFQLRVKTEFPGDVVSLDINAPDRTMGRIYGQEGQKRISVPAGLGGKVWHVRLDVGSATEYVPREGSARFPTIPIQLDIKGLPPYLAPTWEQWFDPRHPGKRSGS